MFEVAVLDDGMLDQLEFQSKAVISLGVLNPQYTFYPELVAKF